MPLLSFFLAASLFTWPAPTQTMRPWTRWWWLGSAVDEPNLTRLLRQFHDAGLGGVEICPIYGAHGYENRFIPYLSPQWMKMFAATTREAARLGLGVDLTTGTGWPMGGPWISPEYSSSAAIWRKSSGGLVQRRAIQKVKRAAPGDEGLVVDPFSPEAMDRFLSRFDQAFRGYSGAPPRAEFHDSYEYWGASWTNDFFAEFKRRRGYDLHPFLPALFRDADPDTAARVRRDYRATLNDLHQAYIRRWTEWSHAHGSLTREQAHGAPANLEDLYAAADIPETEGRFLGSAEELMPVVQIASSAAHVSGRPLASSETFTWLGEHFRVSLADLKPAADFFFLAGVNHLFFHGIPYSPSDVPWPGWLFYASVNLGPTGGLWHDLPGFNGYATRIESILQSGSPGNDLLLYFPVSDFWQDPAEPPTAPWGGDRSPFNGLQVGPEELEGAVPPPVKLFEIDGDWMQGSSFQRAALALLRNGYSYDEVTDHFLAGATVRDGRVRLGGNAYEAIVIPSCRLLPLETLEKLVLLEKAGAKILVEGNIPSDVPGLGRLAERRAEFRSWVGRFHPLRGGDLPSLLERAGVRRETMADQGLRFIRRRRADGWDYFIVNRTDRSFEGWVPLATPARSAVILDPMFGEKSGLAAVEVEAGASPILPVAPEAAGRRFHASAAAAKVYLQLSPGQSLILRTSIQPLEGPPWLYESPSGPPRAIPGPWRVHFLEGGPVMPKDFSSPALGSWTDEPDPEARRFAGTARYSTEFEIDPSTAPDWRLELGGVGESARVRLNGREIALLWSPPFSVPVGRHLRPGRNLLEIDVTNLASNRIADLDRRRVPWKIFYEINFVDLLPGRHDYQPFDASHWPIRPSGLFGPVRLIPLTAESPAAKIAGR